MMRSNTKLCLTGVKTSGEQALKVFTFEFVTIDYLKNPVIEKISFFVSDNCIIDSQISDIFLCNVSKLQVYFTSKYLETPREGGHLSVV